MAISHVWMLSVHTEMTSLLVRMETGNVRMPVQNPASNFRRIDGREDFHTATARALQREKWAK
jgi:hypothetical protein